MRPRIKLARKTPMTNTVAALDSVAKTGNATVQAGSAHTSHEEAQEEAQDEEAQEQDREEDAEDIHSGRP